MERERERVLERKRAPRGGESKKDGKRYGQNLMDGFWNYRFIRKKSFEFNKLFDNSIHRQSFQSETVINFLKNVTCCPGRT